MSEKGEAKNMNIRRFIDECLRVLRITKKPGKIEYKTIVKASGIGILIIGFIGFLLHMLGYGVTHWF